jgi:DNA polymerase III subunit alpha, Gram-positive type
MKIRKPDPYFARLLVTDLIEKDPRLVLNGDTVELRECSFARRDLWDTDFVVFDLETTGSKAPPCRVTEIGAYRVRNGQVLDTFQTLLNPQMSIPPFITALTGISDDMVRDAPLFEDIAADFLEFIGDSVLVAHNSGFDMRFLNHEIGRIHPDYKIANPCLCTVQLSRRLLPDIENHKLKTVAAHYDIDLTNHHRAPADAFATAHIFVNLLTHMRSEGVIDLASARNYTSRRNYYARRHSTTGRQQPAIDHRPHAAE